MIKNVIIFLWKGVIGKFGGWVKIYRICIHAFWNLKVYKQKIVPGFQVSLFFSSNVNFSLQVYQQAAASTASRLSCWIMSLFKMTFELLFTSKQNSITFVAHYNVFLHSLSIQ